jgi:ankyrin repeat protein
VLAEFRESDILIRAIQRLKINTIKWLLTMNINYLVQDENGATALMHAAKSNTFLFVIEAIISKSSDCLFVTDNNNEHALFYAASHKTFKMLLDTELDVNHINKYGDNLLISCCKNKRFKNFREIVKITKDVNHVNYEGKNVAMYLVEEGRYEELIFLSKNNLDFYYTNKNNETLVTVLMKKFKEVYDTGKYQYIRVYVYTMFLLIYFNCDFNVRIDKEGNTPIMYFIMVGDYFSTVYLLEKCQSLDLSIKNYNGISVSYLLLNIHPIEKTLTEYILDYPTFDYNYTDIYNNSLVIHCIVRGNFDDALELIMTRKNVNIRNQLNNKRENALIIATKLGVLRDYLLQWDYINQQDYLGNTALYYALKLRDLETINLLLYYKANPFIKNFQGVSAYDLAVKINDAIIFSILNNPVSPEAMRLKMKSKSYKKTTDGKTNEYVKNYQIKNYKQEYKNIKEYRLTYAPLNNRQLAYNYLANIYLYLYSTPAPYRIETERKIQLVDSNEIYNDSDFFTFLELGELPDNKVTIYWYN